MAKITKEQIMKVNSKCHNGWQLDTQYYLFHGEKILFKNIDISAAGSNARGKSVLSGYKRYSSRSRNIVRRHF